MSDKQQADAEMVGQWQHTTSTCTLKLGVLAFFHPLVISIPLTLNIGGIDGGKAFRLATMT
jgi:hypothetical protein